MPSPSTLSSLLPSLCRGLMLSMSSTSTCDTAARRCLEEPAALVFRASGPPTLPPHHVSVGCEAEAPDAQPWSPRLYRPRGEPETGGKRCEGGLNTIQLLINRLKSPLAFSLWECPALSPFNFLSYFAFFCYEDDSITPLPHSCHFFGITVCSLQETCLLMRTLYILSISQQQGCLFKEKKK